MYSEYVLTLPGGFQLPIRLVRETVTRFLCEEQERDPQDAEEAISGFAESYLRSQMIAGTILDRTEIFETDGVFRLTGRYACQEMIGREKPEQIGVYHGKTD